MPNSNSFASQAPHYQEGQNEQDPLIAYTNPYFENNDLDAAIAAGQGNGQNVYIYIFLYQ